jgi:hypothetical protein
MNRAGACWRLLFTLSLLPPSRGDREDFDRVDHMFAVNFVEVVDYFVPPCYQTVENCI